MSDYLDLAVSLVRLAGAEACGAVPVDYAVCAAEARARDNLAAVAREWRDLADAAEKRLAGMTPGSAGELAAVQIVAIATELARLSAQARAVI